MAEDTSVDIQQYPAQPLPVACDVASSHSYDATPASSETSVTPPHDAPSVSSEVLDIKPILPQNAPPDEATRVEDEYKLKWISWRNCLVPIVTQNQNGPCPLIAIANVLLLRRKITLLKYQTTITSSELITHITDNILKHCPENDTEMMLNFEQNLQDAISLLPQLFTGLDVNVKFTGVTDFEFTQACTVFDLLSIPLYHGWVVDPQAYGTVEAIGNMGYNELVETIIQGKMSSDNNDVTKALLAEQFLETSASQLTYHGLYELSSAMRDGELGVLFRNNHFSTIYKLKVPDIDEEMRQKPSKEVNNPMQNALFVLVTDQGFLHESSVVWEMLCNIEGDSMFVDSNFSISRPTTYDPTAKTTITEEQQIDQDPCAKKKVAMKLTRLLPSWMNRLNFLSSCVVYFDKSGIGDSYMVALAVQESLCQLDDTDSVLEDFKKAVSLDGQSQWPDEQLARWLSEEEEGALREEERMKQQKAHVPVANCASCASISSGGAAANDSGKEEQHPCSCERDRPRSSQSTSYPPKTKGVPCTIL